MTTPSAVSAHAVLDALDRWVQAGWLRDLDLAFARFLHREAADASPLLLLGAALASHQLGRGHACLVLDAVLADPARVLGLAGREALADGAVPPVLPVQLLAGVDLDTWCAALHHDTLVGDGAGDTPLVRCGARLYLRRYWQHEQDVRATLERRAGEPPVPVPDTGALRRALDVLFPPQPGAPLDWQKLACALAARSGFAIVTGGPGTGKTTTVVKLLALLQHLSLGAPGGSRTLRIRLAAPTGKAAARLNESIAGAVKRLDLAGLDDGERVRAAIPTEVTTLHRLLGSRPDTRHFRHDAHHPLALDLLVIDEASMVDLEMMASVLAALPARARLVLLGDKDQLASVEAGAVLGELCRRADDGHYLPHTRDWLQAVAGEAPDDRLVDAAGRPLDQCIAKLRHSYRFSGDSGIGLLADAVNRGDAAAVRGILRHGHADLVQVDAAADPRALQALVLDGGYRHALDVVREAAPHSGASQAELDAWARAVIAAFGAFQLLCAVRQGPQGVEEMNRRIERLLREAPAPAAAPWYAGRPVMVTRNDRDLGLMNGDVGITLPVPIAGAAGTTLRVAFPSVEGSGVRWVLPSRLQSVETAFAMTVHKSQGSEFRHAALLLPAQASPVLTRELVYTGITRARERFTLVTSDPGGTLLESAIVQRVERASGIMD